MTNTGNKIIYTHTDEAPALATYSFLPIIKAFTAKCGVAVETRDISLAGRVIAAFSDSLPKEQQVPDALAELGELAKRAESVTTVMQKGDLSAVWYPAIGAKDVALALEQNHVNELPEAERPKLASAVRRLTLAAWRIDSAGDLGNRELLLPLYRDFSAAVADIQMIY